FDQSTDRPAAGVKSKPDAVDAGVPRRRVTDHQPDSTPADGAERSIQSTVKLLFTELRWGSERCGCRRAHTRDAYLTLQHPVAPVQRDSLAHQQIQHIRMVHVSRHG